MDTCWLCLCFRDWTWASVVRLLIIASWHEHLIFLLLSGCWKLYFLFSYFSVVDQHEVDASGFEQFMIDVEMDFQKQSQLSSSAGGFLSLGTGLQ